MISVMEMQISQSYETDSPKPSASSGTKVFLWTK